MVWTQVDTDEVTAILARAKKYKNELRDTLDSLHAGIDIFINLSSDEPKDVDGTPLSDANRTALKNRCIAKINTMLPADD